MMDNMDHLMPPKVAPRVRMSGDEDGCRELYRYAQQQYNELRRQMGFGGLFQSDRRLFTPDGAQIRIRIRGTLSEIDIHVPPGVGPTPEPLEISEIGIECFCNCCFAEARVLERYENYDFFGVQSRYHLDYPLYCSLSDMSIVLYGGIRYKVDVCQKRYSGDGQLTSHKRKFIAPSIGFTNYLPGDVVIVMFRGRWKDDQLDMTKCNLCQRCMDGCRANKLETSVERQADGSFVIVPFDIPQVTRYVDERSYSS